MSMHNGSGDTFKIKMIHLRKGVFAKLETFPVDVLGTESNHPKVRKFMILVCPMLTSRFYVSSIRRAVIFYRISSAILNGATRDGG